MKKIFKHVICCMVLGSVLSAWAETSKSTDGFWQEAGRDFTSPVTTDAKNILLPGTLLTGLLLLEKKNISDPIQDSVSTRRPLGSSSKYGDLMGQVVPNAIYAGSMWAYSYFEKSALAEEQALVMVKATLYSGIFTDVFKAIAREERPDSSNNQSFPSGHSTSAFAFASVVHAEHGWAWAVPAYALASFVGYSRINDNKHYFHDVVAGAVVGTSYGFGLHYRSLKQKPRGDSAAAIRRAPRGYEYSFMPVVAHDFAGLSLFGEF